MPKFVVEGGHRLKGTIRPAGNKNAALPMLAATLLTDEEVILENVPDIRDARTLMDLLKTLGAEVEWQGDHTVRVRAREVGQVQLDSGQAARIRASILLAGPMVARTGEMRLPPPGGDVIGRRRMDTHFLALGRLGAETGFHRDVFGLRSNGRLKGTDIFLDEPSVTATENALMAASLAQGTTRLRNAAAEPHVQDLCHMLVGMGAQISGIGTNLLEIEGQERLRGGRFRITSDHIEVGSFISLAVATHGEILIEDAAIQHLDSTLIAFDRLGVRTEIRGDDLFIPADQERRIKMDLGGYISKIDDGPWPAFPADLTSVTLVAATQCEGTILIHEKMFESRMFFTDKLVSMGARLILCDPHRVVVVGPSQLHGAVVESPDIRAGMALLIAALSAEGTSEIYNIGQIERGYERIDERLRALGAVIERNDSRDAPDTVYDQDTRAHLTIEQGDYFMADEQRRSGLGGIGDGIRTGIGILSAFGEAVEETLQEAVDRGDLTPERARRAMQDAAQRLQSGVEGARDKLDFVSRREVEALQAELAELRARVTRLEGGEGLSETPSGIILTE